jgi:hypothetical protein
MEIRSRLPYLLFYLMKILKHKVLESSSTILDLVAINDK